MSYRLPALETALSSLSVECVVEFGSCLELCHLLGCYLYLLLRRGIDTLAGGTLVYAERSEAYERNLVACYERVLNCCNCCVKSLLCLCLRQA